MMLTRCPYCSTTFRVTPEQLKVRQGQVRCGQCRRVFDGLRGLAENEAAPQTITPSPAAQPKPDPHADLTWTIVQPAPPGAAVAPEAPASLGFATVAEIEPEPSTPVELEPAIGFQSLDAPAATPQPEPEIEVVPEPEPEIVPEPKPEPPADETPPPAPIEPEAPRLPGEDDEIEHIELDVDPLGPLTEPSPDDDTPQGPPARSSFEMPVREPDPPTIFDLHEPAVARAGPGWPWILGSLVALLLAAAQLAVHYRTDLIATYPGTRPTFVAACDLLGCQIALPRKIDLISIDASDLVPDDKRPGTLHLSATLRNRARYAQAWPHLEITLADAQEHPLLRRALAPADYLPADIDSAKGFPARSEQTVQLALTTDVAAVGYRLYVFHP
jgi:predicted Zn finger-like uncharacterized protein